MSRVSASLVCVGGIGLSVLAGCATVKDLGNQAGNIQKTAEAAKKGKIETAVKDASKVKDGVTKEDPADKKLAGEVHAALVKGGFTKEGEIEVEAKAGVVTLKGKHALKDTPNVIEAAKKVKGVTKVESELTDAAAR